MWNPFSTPVNSAVLAFNPAVVQPDDTDTENLTSNAVELDDALYPDAYANQYRGNVGNMDQSQRPAYAGADYRELVYTPDALPSYNFLAPAPGSTDLAMARDFNSVPGTSQLNIMHGPVTGNAMDSYQEGNRQVLAATPPGQYGPVVGGDDYSTVVSNATFQEAFAAYSNDASNQTIVSAI